MLDCTGKEALVGKTGRTVTTVAWVMKGYDKEAELTVQVIKDGWFDTADPVRVGEDGYLERIERRSSIIVTLGGAEISPVKVAAVLLGHPAAETACVGGVDEYKGQIPTALIVPGEGQDATVEEIRNFCCHSLRTK